MRRWTREQIARAAGALVLGEAPAPDAGPERVTIDSRDVDAGALFVGLPGTNTHGGVHAGSALANGAWGVLTSPEHAQTAREHHPRATVLAAEDPLQALQRLATAWRRELGAKVVGVTGSTGKTTTKDLLQALVAPHRATIASRANFNTEIGLPLEILAAPETTEVLILEMAMRGAGQIAELARIAEPDVGVIVSIGPVHLELLGTIEAIAAAKCELLAALPAGGTAVVPSGESLLEPYLGQARAGGRVRVVSFGPGGDVKLVEEDERHVTIDLAGEPVRLEVAFSQAHLRGNLLAAVAAASAVGVTPHGQLEFVPSRGRGRQETLPGGVTLIDDCYNANPMSMRAALDDLAATASRGATRRRVAVLGDMLELGPEAPEFHAEIGAHADHTADLLVTVGPLAAHMADRYGGEHHHAADAAEAAQIAQALVRPGDVVLVKASRGVALERVCDALAGQAVA